MQESPASAVLGIAGDSDAWATLAPMARTTDVPSGWVGKEDVSALVSTLSPAFESSAGGGEGGEIGVIIDSHKDICVLRVVLVGC